MIGSSFSYYVSTFQIQVGVWFPVKQNMDDRELNLAAEFSFGAHVLLQFSVWCDLFGSNPGSPDVFRT